MFPVTLIVAYLVARKFHDYTTMEFTKLLRAIHFLTNVYVRDRLIYKLKLYFLGSNFHKELKLETRNLFSVF